MEMNTYQHIVSRLRDAGCVFAEDEARMLISAAKESVDLAGMVEQRALGYPLEHVIGWMAFYGLRIEVDPGVFIPRPRTEFLVRRAAEMAKSGSIVVDLCCGSGALGAALAATIEGIELYAVDIDPAAVQCARRNITAAGGEVFEGDLFEPLPARLRNKVDILLANVPYVPTGAIELLPSEARIHEARLALDGGVDGLDVQRRVALEAPQWLAPGGHLLVEVSERQAPQAVEIFACSGLIPTVSRLDDLDATVIIGTRPGLTRNVCSGSVWEKDSLG
ncbi:putative protein N(5)-glutamine methyltransferase [Paenibacillus sp. 5J-6]|uniref:peptide chain release factor N(5)-glutamine methyltransferase n=1 Tax=Paenibacillus silvestris TaxID=2606219 RepID=A0A6L8UUR3_9BACL|nr:putative protein N(5)-glutamine methyltransferase [Paenibacillus silvestris]MZQ80889.1 putative protein N(5)-glutamine methyltransferase [Paenibacillus silvestris]